MGRYPLGPLGFHCPDIIVQNYTFKKLSSLEIGNEKSGHFLHSETLGGCKLSQVQNSFYCSYCVSMIM